MWKRRSGCNWIPGHLPLTANFAESGPGVWEALLQAGWLTRMSSLAGQWRGRCGEDRPECTWEGISPIS